MSGDTEALTEKLWDAITEIRDDFPRSHRDAPTTLLIEAAILPIIAAEVRKGQAAALRGWALGVESELDASRAHGIDLGEWGRGLRSGVRQALQTADRIEQEAEHG